MWLAAGVQCFYAGRGRSNKSRRQCTICGIGVQLYLYHRLHLYCLLNPAWDRLPLQWINTAEVRIGPPLPRLYDPCGVSPVGGSILSQFGYSTGCSVTFQWLFWGYSLAYSRDGGPFIGTLQNIGLMNVMVAPSPGSAVLPEIVFCLFQLLFCACTV